MRGEEEKKEKMLSAIIENAREAVVSVDADGKIIYANKATEELFGWKIEELVGKPMSILAVDAEEQKKQFMEALKKGGTRFETVRKARDGSIIPVMMTVVPFKDENGNLIFSSGIMVDIREQKKYESKIEH
ncbi:MAG: PAS domain S-box protein, partial [Thermoplasmata archaeon]